jgi:hypothetical protein
MTGAKGGVPSYALMEMPEHKQKEFIKDLAKFYNMEEKKLQKLDFNKLYQASRETKGMVNPLNVPSEVKNHPDFTKNVKGFCGLKQNDDTESNYNRNINKFYGANSQSQGGIEALNQQ